jgi:carbonic anhydrase
MSTTDQALSANQLYSDKFNLAHLKMPPAKKLAVLACMDARLTVEDILGLNTGEAHIIRNAGGIVTEDAIRSLIISHHLLGTNEVILIHHTDCGMLTFADHELKTQLEKQTGASSITPEHFHDFEDLKADVQRQIGKIKSHPWIPDSITVRGFIFDVSTGVLNEVNR